MNKVIRFDGRSSAAGRAKKDASVTGDLDLRCAKRPLTDLGNAERFELRMSGRLLWCFELGWAWWDGRRWSFDDAEAKVLSAVHGVVRAIQDEAAALEESGDDILISEATRTKPDIWLHDKVRDWGRSSESDARMNAIAKQARAKLSARPDDLDADPMKFTVLNGTLIFRRPKDVSEGEDLIILKPHDQADRITKLAPVIFDPEAQCPVFDAFFPAVQPEETMRRFLMQWFGYSLTGLVKEQKFAFFFGAGSNGKSTLMDAVAELMGEYADTIGIESLLDDGNKRKGSDATPDIAGLKGVRLLRSSEPEKGAKMAEAKIKAWTGGEPIKVRFLNKEFFTLRPSFKLTISGNHRPQVVGADHGYWRRNALVPWDRIIADEDKDLELPTKLIAEYPGILNRLLDGARDYLENGLQIPEIVKEATKRYREDSDPLGRFTALALVEETGGRIQSSMLFEVFKAWARWAGEKEWSQKGFSQAMKDRGYQTKQSDVIWWTDVRLVKDILDFQAGSPPSGLPDDMPEERG